MQIYAFDAQNTLTLASNANRGIPYICPECRGRVQLRGGKLRQSHFYHPGSAPCRLSNKSLTHLNIQHALQKMLAPERILIEHRFPQIGRIADVVWPAKQLIFEVQVSAISPDEIKARNQDYSRVGYHVIWILHDRTFNRNRLSQTELLLRSSPHYFTNINMFGKGFFYDQYSSILLGKRVNRSPRFPINFKKITPIDLKQLPRQFPNERKKWPFCVEGDIYNCKFIPSFKKSKPISIFQQIAHIHQGLLNIVLEKHCD